MGVFFAHNPPIHLWKPKNVVRVPEVAIARLQATAPGFAANDLLLSALSQASPVASPFFTAIRHCLGVLAKPRNVGVHYPLQLFAGIPFAEVLPPNKIKLENAGPGWCVRPKMLDWLVGDVEQLQTVFVVLNTFGVNGTPGILGIQT